MTFYTNVSISLFSVYVNTLMLRKATIILFYKNVFYVVYRKGCGERNTMAWHPDKLYTTRDCRVTRIYNCTNHKYGRL
ncbi:hypothetical protein BDV37DRAFT_243419 [Aspergillus pseudonomiae]|uniref:Uncharacterized protein n=1 Tax=Aspergillus pseudonomiae TaxID=1506151 RepID=A0A5N7DIC9_9EURO|nr:uncharacterized protein BDV37DRAFT_243419 [Aspergillus pseudonomiae]KAE8406216.1 hypothetical protein BDV37DRAFT_243419 [Aspergillus pseudonomiae]